MASSLFFLILLVLGALTALFIALRRPDHGAVRAGLRRPAGAARPDGRTSSRLMFPIVVLLALSGLVVGMLNSFDHFACRRSRRWPGTW